MKILGINTATTNLGLAIIDEDKVLQEKTLEGPTAKAEQMIPWIEEMLNSSGLNIKDIEGIGVAVGPGAFTGLRIGVTTAKTLAQTLKVPLVGVSTLKAFAAQFLTQDIPKLRIVLSACRGDVNTGLFKLQGGKLEQLEKDSAVNAAELLVKMLSEDSELAGDLPDEFAARTLSKVSSAVSVAKLALQNIKDKKTSDPLELVPVYSHGPNIRLSPRIHGKLLNKNAN